MPKLFNSMYIMIYIIICLALFNHIGSIKYTIIWDNTMILVKLMFYIYQNKMQYTTVKNKYHIIRNLNIVFWILNRCETDGLCPRLAIIYIYIDNYKDLTAPYIFISIISSVFLNSMRFCNILIHILRSASPAFL